MTADDIYQYFLSLIRKNQSGSISSIEFAQFWNAEQNAYLGDMLGHFQRNNNAKTGLNTGLVLNETTLTKLTVVTVPLRNLAVLAGGEVPKPADLAYTLLILINNTEAQYVSSPQLYAPGKSVIDPPSIPSNKYYYTEYLSNWAVFPSTVSTIDVDYIKRPVQVKWAYTFDGAGRQIYDPTNSVDPEWDDISCEEITRRTIKSAGLALASKDFEQYGESNIQTGN